MHSNSSSISVSSHRIYNITYYMLHEVNWTISQRQRCNLFTTFTSVSQQQVKRKTKRENGLRGRGGQRLWKKAFLHSHYPKGGWQPLVTAINTRPFSPYSISWHL